MRKELTFTMSQQIIDMASKPLRKREDAILLLLYTIRMFDLDNSQFIVSTHSPFIVQSLDADELFDIKTMQYAEEGNYRGRIFV